MESQFSHGSRSILVFRVCSCLCCRGWQAALVPILSPRLNKSSIYVGKRRPEGHEAFHITWHQGHWVAGWSYRIIWCRLKTEDLLISRWELSACPLRPPSAAMPCKAQHFFLPPVLGLPPAWCQEQWLWQCSWGGNLTPLGKGTGWP